MLNEKKTFLVVFVFALLCSSIFYFNLDFAGSDHELVAEASSMKEKQLRETYKKLMETIEVNPNIPYAGSYFDEAGTLHIGLSKNNEKNQMVILNMLGDASTRFFDTEYTYEELRSKQIKFRDEWDTATVGFSALDSNGKKGIVISGHSVSGVGDWVWQADGIESHYAGGVSVTLQEKDIAIPLLFLLLKM
jgi:hypothetical protein